MYISRSFTRKKNGRSLAGNLDMQAGGEINRGYVDIVRNRKHPYVLWKAVIVSLVRLFCVPLLYLAGIVVTGMLRRRLAGKHGQISDFNRKAADNAKLFADQYPFLLYAVVCKSFELAHLRDELANLTTRDTRIVELAIGEGSFSARIFPKSPGIVGLDLDPYMLRKAKNRGHVREGVVGDCLNPAFRDGSFDLLVSNNFMHHVTEKRPTLSNWARIGETVIFNENTFYWASGWFIPFALRRLGFEAAGLKQARKIEATHLQCLLRMEELDAISRDVFEVQNRLTYLSESSFALCALFSFLMKRTGPPAPTFLKWVFGGALRSSASGMTTRLSELVILCDQFEDRSTDTFVSYRGRSRGFRKSEGAQDLLCPACRVPLDAQLRCALCAAAYARIDDMIFLLPREMDHIRADYDHAHVGGVPADYL
jgi:SAM-dependent methyltransferase